MYGEEHPMQELEIEVGPVTTTQRWDETSKGNPIPQVSGERTTEQQRSVQPRCQRFRYIVEVLRDGTGFRYRSGLRLMANCRGSIGVHQLFHRFLSATKSEGRGGTGVAQSTIKTRSGMDTNIAGVESTTIKPERHRQRVCHRPGKLGRTKGLRSLRRGPSGAGVESGRLMGWAQLTAVRPTIVRVSPCPTPCPSRLGFRCKFAVVLLVFLRQRS